jgi:hypothetical protein
VVSEAWDSLLIAARWWVNAQLSPRKVALQKFPFWAEKVLGGIENSELRDKQ